MSTACAVAEAPVEPALQAGVAHSTEFEPFRTGDKMDVLTAVQAGLWLMPTLRHQGLVGDPELSCTVFDLDNDFFLADQAAHVNSKEFEGWTNVLYNMQVRLPDEAMDDMTELPDYDGDRVLFDCTATDEAGSVLRISHEMVLSVQ